MTKYRVAYHSAVKTAIIVPPHKDPPAEWKDAGWFNLDDPDVDGADGQKVIVIRSKKVLILFGWSDGGDWDVIDWGNHPDQSLPPIPPDVDNELPSEGHPDQGLPPAHGHPDNSLPITPGKPIEGLPDRPDNALPGEGLDPPHPDNTLPSGGQVDNSLPGQPGRPDQGLPNSPNRPDQGLPPAHGHPDQSPGNLNPDLDPNLDPDVKRGQQPQPKAKR